MVVVDLTKEEGALDQQEEEADHIPAAAAYLERASQALYTDSCASSRASTQIATTYRDENDIVTSLGREWKRA